MCTMINDVHHAQVLEDFRSEAIHLSPRNNQATESWTVGTQDTGTDYMYWHSTQDRASVGDSIHTRPHKLCSDEQSYGGASALQASRQCHLATLTGPTDSHSAVFWHGSRGEELAPLPRLENFTFLPGSIWQHNLAHEGILDPSQRRVLWNVHAGEQALCNVLSQRTIYVKGTRLRDMAGLEVISSQSNQELRDMIQAKAGSNHRQEQLLVLTLHKIKQAED